MVKTIHISRLEVVCKKNSYACAPPEIELIYIVEKHNTLITINFWASDNQGVEAPRPQVFTQNDTQRGIKL